MALDTDVLAYLLNNPQYVPLGVMALSGYVLFAILYRKTKYWKEFSGTERAFLGGTLGILIGVLLIAPIVQVMLFWSVGAQALVVNIASALVSALVAAEVFAIRISGVKEIVVLRYFYGAILVAAAFSGLIFLAAGIISFSAASYDKYVILYVQQPWNSFFGTCLSAFVLSLFVLMLFRHTIVQNLRSTLESDVGTLKINLGKRGRPSYFRILRRFLGRKSVRCLLAWVIIVTVLSAAVVPLDQNQILFTPKLIAGHESFYAAEACPGDAYSHLLMIRTSDRVYKFYQKMRLSYNLTLPSLKRLVAFVSVQNPSNFSVYVREAGDIYYEPWSYLLPSSSSDISFSYSRANGKVTSIVANLTAVTNATAHFSVSYYNEFLKRSVKVSEFENSARIDNSTTLETSTFIITNDDQFCLTIPRMELEKLRYEGVNASLAEVYVNGQIFPITVGGGFVHAWVTVRPQSTANITITYPKRSTQV
jgi:hypothetical protein